MGGATRAGGRSRTCSRIRRARPPGHRHAYVVYLRSAGLRKCAPCTPARAERKMACCRSDLPCMRCSRRAVPRGQGLYNLLQAPLALGVPASPPLLLTGPVTTAGSFAGPPPARVSGQGSGTSTAVHDSCQETRGAVAAGARLQRVGPQSLHAHAAPHAASPTLAAPGRAEHAQALTPRRRRAGTRRTHLPDHARPLPLTCRYGGGHRL